VLILVLFTFFGQELLKIEISERLYFDVGALSWIFEILKLEILLYFMLKVVFKELCAGSFSFPNVACRKLYKTEK
jgi:hypothetical protein